MDSSSSEEELTLGSKDHDNEKQHYDQSKYKKKLKGMELVWDNFRRAAQQTVWSILWLAIFLMLGYGLSHF